MGTRIVKNYPSPRLMETIGATNQSAPEAIGELVANCFDARYEDEQLTIIVDMRDNHICVIDNGKGMTSEILEKAVCIAEDMSKHIERGEGAKGHFGMGFKTSCATLGGFYEIFTRPVGQNKDYHVEFDINDYSRRPSGANAWDIEINDEISQNKYPLYNLDHGSAFVISKLKNKNITLSAVLDYLGEAFKGHLENGDKIIIMDSTGKHYAEPKEYSFVPNSKVYIDTYCGDNNRYHITGWMAIDSQTHNDGLYGFNIYRHNQLVVKWDKSWFRAHLMTSRIIGEVNMDFLDATFYKQGIQQSHEWTITSSHMRDYLKPIVKASNNLSKKGNINKPAESKKIIGEMLNDYGEEAPTVIESDNDYIEKPAFSSKSTSINDDIKNIVSEKSLIIKDEGEINITYVVKEMHGNVLAPFDYIYSEAEDDESSSELQVILYRSHPLWEKKNDSETIKILATSDAIYRLLVEKLEFETPDALKIRNEWVWNRVSKEETNG